MEPRDTFRPFNNKNPLIDGQISSRKDSEENSGEPHLPSDNKSKYKNSSNLSN